MFFSLTDVCMTNIISNRILTNSEPHVAQLFDCHCTTVSLGEGHICRGKLSEAHFSAYSVSFADVIMDLPGKGLF